MSSHERDAIGSGEPIALAGATSDRTESVNKHSDTCRRLTSADCRVPAPVTCHLAHAISLSAIGAAARSDRMRRRLRARPIAARILRRLTCYLPGDGDGDGTVTGKRAGSLSMSRSGDQ